MRRSVNPLSAKKS